METVEKVVNYGPRRGVSASLVRLEESEGSPAKSAIAAFKIAGREEFALNTLIVILSRDQAKIPPYQLPPLSAPAGLCRGGGGVCARQFVSPVSGRKLSRRGGHVWPEDSPRGPGAHPRNFLEDYAYQ